MTENDVVHLDPDRCYRAILSRDRRFDGVFFTGVVTTGVYCRPVCPVRPPLLKNCRFFPSAAAAEEDGFRPCLRCHPEASAGTPAWAEVPEVVSRGLALIQGGGLDSDGVDVLAGRLGLGDRQLRRLFVQHLGAGPIAVAKARRVHFARRLLDETSLPVTQIAFAAGFRSVRQFNHDVRATFRRTPTELRGRPAQRNGALTVRLAYRPPFDWASLAGFLAARATRGVEIVTAERYARTVSTGDAPGWIEVAPADGHLTLTMHLSSHDGLIGVVERTRRLFDLGADPAAIGSHLGSDSFLAPLVSQRPGLRVPGCWDAFETAVRAVLGQQISVRAATTLAGRLVETFGKPAEGIDDPALTHLFPAPASLADAALETIGCTRQVAAAVRGLAAGVCDGSLALDASRGLDDLVSRLCAVRGIGAWTAHVIAMRIGEPDAFPAGDLGVRKALGTKSERAIVARADAWRPWRAYATIHLWTSGSPAQETPSSHSEKLTPQVQNTERPNAGRRKK
jgi:AraC family transcriptional regulator, regulatory protein of adaptative response / DNA-3-methyladenine glycosylase II